MLRPFNVFLFALSLACLLIPLAGCDQVFGSQGAKSTEGAELIRQVLPNWRADKHETPFASLNIKPESDTSVSTLDVTPEKVVQLSDSEVVLITRGAMPTGGHASPALLGAYWFALKDGRWHLARRRDEVAWLGSSGDFGKVTLKPLASGVTGVFVESGWAGGGTDSQWLDAFALDSAGISHVLDSLVIYQADDNTGGYDCVPLLKNPPSEAIRVSTEDTDRMNERCMQLTANWEIVESKSGKFAEIRSHQNKSRVKVETLSIEETNEGHGEVGVYKLRVVHEDSRLVFRYGPKKKAYELQSGRDLRERF